MAERIQAITIDADKISSSLTDWTLLITRDMLANEVVDPSGGNASQADGGDVQVFSDAAYTSQCALEIVGWEHDSSTGAGDADIEAYAILPSVSAVVDTPAYLRYNADSPESQPAASDTYGSENAWDSNYQSVHHCQDAGSTTLLDSTANNFDLTEIGSVGSTSGPFGGTAISLTTTSWYQLTGTPQVTSLPVTFECLSRVPDVTNSWPLMFIGDQSFANYWVGLQARGDQASDPIFAFHHSQGGPAVASAAAGSYSANTWMHAAARFISNTSRTATFNTTHVNNTDSGPVSPSGWDYFSIGRNIDLTPSGTSANGLLLDEVRVSNVARSDAWLDANYYNQLSPGTFASAGTPTSRYPDSVDVADAGHVHTAGNATVGEVHPVAASDATHTHTADASAITEKQPIVGQDASHTHTADASAITSTDSLSPADASHAHTADASAITSTDSIAVQDASHGQTADSVLVSEVHTVACSDASHAHTADSATVSEVHPVDVAAASHGHTADDVLVSEVQTITPAPATHGHTADAVAITAYDLIAVADATHAHTAAGVEIITPLLTLQIDTLSYYTPGLARGSHYTPGLEAGAADVPGLAKGSFSQG